MDFQIHTLEREEIAQVLKKFHYSTTNFLFSEKTITVSETKWGGERK